MNKSFNIIIAGGKTGGHLFPGIAIAQALEKSDHNVKILFVGTSAAFEIQTLEKYGYPHKSILSKPIKGGTIISKTVAAGMILVSLIQSMIIIKSFKPDFILGVGGFSSFAIVLAGKIFGIPTGIQEQNAFPGITNRLLAKFTKTVFTSFKETKGFKTESKLKFVGNPVRKTSRIESEATLFSHKFDPDKATILVTGGSQGASSINTAFMDAIALMDKPQRFNIIHQTGINDEKQILEKYKELEIDARAKAFFHDMPRLQDMTDLAITRAGAGTISEICIKGLPAILIPFPHAADDHQTFNARALEKQGAAVMIKESQLTGHILKKALEKLIDNRKELNRMAKILKSIALPDADEKIAAYILQTKDIKA